MLLSVRTLARISLTMSFAKLLALSLGVLQVPLPRLEQGVADVVGVLAALGFGGGERVAAGFAPEQTAEQVGAGGPARAPYVPQTVARRARALVAAGVGEG